MNAFTAPPRRVLLVTASYLPQIGGLQHAVAHLAEGLAAGGVSVSVLTQRYPRSLPTAEVLDGVPVHRWLFLLPHLGYLRAGRFDLFVAGLVLGPVTLVRLLNRLWRERPTAVNLHFLGSAAPFLLVAHALLRFRLVVSLHGEDVEGLFGRSTFDRWIFRVTLRRAQAVSACSAALLRVALALEPTIAAKASVIHNAVVVPLTPVAEPIPGRLLAVGRLVPKKGFDVLLRALPLLRETWPQAHLVLIGGGPEAARLQTLAADLHLADRVEFTGVQPPEAVRRAMGLSQAVVIPSRREPFGLVALEALAAGRPVVATRVGGLPEVLAGAEAILVPPDSSEALAQGLSDLQAGVWTAPTCGARNRKIAAQFSVERMATAYSALYAGPFRDRAR